MTKNYYAGKQLCANIFRQCGKRENFPWETMYHILQMEKEFILFHQFLLFN